MTKPTDYHIALVLWPDGDWTQVSERPLDRNDMHVALISHFDGDLPADLTTCQVWHFAHGILPRDVTEDILTEIGAHLSATSTAEDYPDAWLDWADSDIQDGLAEMAARDWATDQGIYDMRECAA